MNKFSLNKLSKYVYVSLALVFLVQVFIPRQIIDIYYFLNYFGLAKNIFDIIMSLIYLVTVLLILSIFLSFLNKINIVKGVTKNTVILNIMVEYVRFFIVFFPTWITFSFFNKGLDLNSDNLDLVKFLNIYLFWYLISKAFFRPVISPEFGIEKDEEDGLI